MVSGNCPPVCVCKPIFGVILQRDAGTRVLHALTCVIQFRNWQFPGKALVGNDKALSENLSLAEKTSVEVYQEPRCLVGIKTISICLSVFVIFCGTVLVHKWKVDKTFLLRLLSKKRRSPVGNDKAIFGPELAK